MVDKTVLGWYSGSDQTNRTHTRKDGLSMYDYSMEDARIQEAISEISETGDLITLQDGRFPWIERKVKTLRLSGLYKLAGYPDYSFRAATCATWIQFQVSASGDKQLSAANFCQLRLCPMCISRRAKRAAYKLSQVLDQVEAEHGAMFLFLTLTIKNVDGDHLGEGIGQLTKAWNKLLQHRHVKAAVEGWFRTVEITRKGKGYHPHIHAILAVCPEYFQSKSGLYISHAEWVRRWRLALGVDYDPSVRIQTAKAKGEMVGGRAAALEAAKYAVKDEDYIDPKLKDDAAAQIVKDYTEALHRRRLTAYGGWLKAAAKALDAEDLDDGDLVHIDDETIREDVADLIETYNWHFGAGDYVLTSRQVNPLKLRKE